MALTLSIIPGNNAGSVQGGVAENFVAVVTNSGSSSVTLTSLSVSEPSGTTILQQPQFLTPGQPYALSYPTLAAGATSYFPFQAVFTSPAVAGPSPQNPGGAAPSSSAATPDANFYLQLQSQASDASVASALILVPVLSTIPPFQLAAGGGLQLSQGFNAVNFIVAFA